MEKFRVDFNKEVPKYIQIEKHLKELVEKEKIMDGEKLPSIRTLSSFLKVNKDTIINAYNKLEEDGYAVQKMGSGTYVKKNQSTLIRFKKEYSNTIKKLNYNSNKQYIDFVGESTLSNNFPINNFKKVLNEVLDRDGASAFIYKEVLGYDGLRESISKFFWNGQYSLDDILIVSGAQQGIDVISKAIINNRDNVIVEKPTYNGALSVFNWRRANILEVPLESNGINLNKFEKTLQKNKIKCFYTMSYFQNPSGITYSLEKKKRILQLAEMYDFYIIEDDYLSELIYTDVIKYKSFKSLDKNERVIYIKSFSKIFLPGIRLGYLIPPKRLKESIINFKINTDIATSSLMQRALDLYVTKGYWKNHIENFRESYKITYDFLTDILKKDFKEELTFIPSGGGLSLYVKLNNKIDSLELFYKCRERNVIITPGIFFYKDFKEGLSYFKLGFSNLKEDEMIKGTQVLKDILKRG